MDFFTSLNWKVFAVNANSGHVLKAIPVPRTSKGLNYRAESCSDVSNSSLSSANGWNQRFSSCWRETLWVHNAAFNTLEGFSDALPGTCCKELHQAAHSLLKAAICCTRPADLSVCEISVCVLGQSLWHLCVRWEHSCCCCDTAIPQSRLSSLQNENKCSSCGRCTTVI